MAWTTLFKCYFQFDFWASSGVHNIPVSVLLKRSAGLLGWETNGAPVLILFSSALCCLYRAFPMDSTTPWWHYYILACFPQWTLVSEKGNLHLDLLIYFCILEWTRNLPVLPPNVAQWHWACLIWWHMLADYYHYTQKNEVHETGCHESALSRPILAPGIQICQDIACSSFLPLQCSWLLRYDSVCSLLPLEQNCSSALLEGLHMECKGLITVRLCQYRWFF